MLLDKTDFARKPAADAEAQVVVQGVVVHSGPRARMQALFYEEISKHSAPTQLRIKHADGAYRVALKRA